MHIIISFRVIRKRWLKGINKIYGRLSRKSQQSTLVKKIKKILYFEYELSYNIRPLLTSFFFSSMYKFVKIKCCVSKSNITKT